MQESFKQGRALLCCPAAGHPLLFWSLSNRFPRKLDPAVSWPLLLCVLFKQSLSKCSTQIPFIISLRRLYALPELHSIILFSSWSMAGFSWLGRWRTTEEVIITGYCFFFLKAPLASYLFLSVAYYSVTHLNRKVCFFQTKVAWRRGRGQSRSPVGGILYLGPSHAEVPCSNWSHLTSTVSASECSTTWCCDVHTHSRWSSNRTKTSFSLGFLLTYSTLATLTVRWCLREGWQRMLLVLQQPVQRFTSTQGGHIRKLADVGSTWLLGIS